MANTLYDAARSAFLRGEINMEADTLRLVVFTADYTPDTAADEFLSDIPDAARVATATVTGGSVSAKGGVFDANDTTFPQVTGGNDITGGALYQWTGDAATSRLIMLIDSAGADLPYTPNGGPLVVAWDNGADKVFRL